MLPAITLKKFVFLALALFTFEISSMHILDSGNIRVGDMTVQCSETNKQANIVLPNGWTVSINGKNITTDDHGQTINVETSRMKPFLFGLFCGTVASFGLVIAIGKATLNQKKKPATLRSQ